MHCLYFLCWIKFCSGSFRQVFFHLGGKKVVTGRVGQVVVLYSNNFMGIGLGRLSIGLLDEWLSYRGRCLCSYSFFVKKIIIFFGYNKINLKKIWSGIRSKLNIKNAECSNSKYNLLIDKVLTTNEKDMANHFNTFLHQ